MVYILHFEKPYKHARHYVGFTTDLDRRQREHTHYCRSPLLKAVRAAGIRWYLAVVFEGGRKLERKIKESNHTSRYCPLCNTRFRQFVARAQGDLDNV